MSKPAGERYTVAVDFDGVIHSYLSPWVNAETIPDPPVPGAIEWLFETLQKFDVAITSTRNHQPGGIAAMKAWLCLYAGSIWNEHPGYRGIEDVTFPTEKPAALVYLDDRALRFEGRFPTAQEIHNARPWNKGGTGASKIAGPSSDELMRRDVTADGTLVSVRKLPNDPICLRVSIGGDEKTGYYLSYRGNESAVLTLLEKAFAAFVSSISVGETSRRQSSKEGR